MKTGFKDPIAINNQHPKDNPSGEKKTPWEHQCPQYDERSSCFVNAGTHYGVGHRNPVGLFKAGNSNVIPKGRINTLRVDEKG